MKERAARPTRPLAWRHVAVDAPSSDFERERVRRTIWSAANAMRAAGLNTLDTIEHLGFLLFLRLAAKRGAELPRSAAGLDGLLGDADVLAECASRTDPAAWFNESFFPGFRRRVEAELPDSPVRFLVEGFHPKIEDGRTLLRVLEATEELSLDHEHVDVNGAVYEQLVATLGEAGHLGQYFTPRHIVDLMVALVDPRPGEAVYDPAAGTGGFLLRAGDGRTGVRLHGRELNAVVRRLCVLNFLIHEVDPAGLSDGDSLVAAGQVAGRFDVVLTNPPFGAAIAAHEELWDFPVPSAAAEAMFLQHVVASLAEGGRAAVVLPEGLLTNLGNDARVRRWLLREASVEAVVSLPSGVFHPYTAVRTGIVLLRKPGPSRSVWLFDVRRDGYELNAGRRPNGDSDLPRVLAEIGARGDGEQSALVAVDDLAQTRLVAARYVRGAGRRSSPHALVEVGELASVRREQVRPGADPDERFLCLGLEHVEARTGRVSLPDPVPGAAIKSVKCRFSAGDLLYGRLRPYLAKVALAPCDGICSTELVVLRVDGARVDPVLLAALLRSPEVTEQATSLMVGANHPRIGVDDLLGLRVPLPSPRGQSELVARLGAFEDEIAAATARIAALRHDVAATVGALWD